MSIGVVISSRLDNVDLARSRPGPIHIVHRQHPDGRPKPVTLWQLGCDLNPTVFDGCTFLGIDTAGFGRLDNGTVGNVRGRDAISDYGRGTGSISRQVDDSVCFDKCSILQGWLDDKLSILDVYVLVCGCGLLELSVAAGMLAAGVEQGRIFAYPKPPTSASLVQTWSFSPWEKSSLRTEQ